MFFPSSIPCLPKENAIFQGKSMPSKMEPLVAGEGQPDPLTEEAGGRATNVTPPQAASNPNFNGKRCRRSPCSRRRRDLPSEPLDYFLNIAAPLVFLLSYHAFRRAVNTRAGPRRETGRTARENHRFTLDGACFSAYTPQWGYFDAFMFGRVIMIAREIES